MPDKKIHINVAPLVDVMLVLLIIFMITSPMMHSSVDVNLPRTKEESTVNLNTVTITVTKEGVLYVNDKRVDTNSLQPVLKKLAKPDDPLLFKADKTVPYDKVFEVMKILVNAGYSKISLVAELQ